MAHNDYRRDRRHNDAQHEAASSGFHAGWNAANYADAYGDDGQTIRPSLRIVRSGHAREYWEAYTLGRDEYTCMANDCEMYA